MASEDSEAGAAFWRAAIEIYARPGAQAVLLDLQDGHGGDVMALLWTIAAADRGRSIREADLAAFERATAVARRRADGLRARRRRLKPGPAAAYAAAKADELAAERAVATAAPDPAAAGRPAAATPALAAANLAVAAGRLRPALDRDAIRRIARTLGGPGLTVP